MTQFTGLNVSANYTYDPSGLRVARAVNGVTTYTVRSAGGTVLSEYRAACGAPTWTRDVLYAGGRLLGSIKATNTEPTVALTTAAGTVSESTATLNATIALTAGGPLACPVTVTYGAIAGSASAGVDYKLAAGAVTFNAGAATGTTRTIILEILPDTIDENDETLSLTLTSAVGAQVSGASTQEVTIVDDDPFPGVRILDTSVWETDTGTAVAVSVQLDAPSARTIALAYATANGSAVAPGDYAAGSGVVTFARG